MLAENERTWTDEYARFKTDAATAPKAALFRYRHPDIKDALRGDSFDKCAYCESKVSHVSPAQTDHILPISKHHNLVVAWDNLAYVCEQCNRPKGDYDDAAIPLLNPYIEDQSAHLAFYGPLPLHLTSRGRVTIHRLELARTALLARRSDRIRSVLDLIELWEAKAGDEAARAVLKQLILDECRQEKEFTLAVQSFVRTRTGWDVR